MCGILGVKKTDVSRFSSQTKEKLIINNQVKFMKKKNLLFYVAGAMLLVACSDNGVTEATVPSTDVTDETTESTTEVLRTDEDVRFVTQSSCATTVSFYTDEACTNPIAVNVPVNGGEGVVLPIPTYLENVYVQYPTAAGTSTMALSMKQEPRVPHYHWINYKGRMAWVHHITCGRNVDDPDCYFSFSNEKPSTPPSCEDGGDGGSTGGDGGSTGGDGGSTGGDGGSTGGDGGSTGGDDSGSGFVIGITLPEDAVESYTTTHAYTSYHSSGVVMFDGGWPASDPLSSSCDLNDLVIDYDLESNVLDPSDDDFAAQDWREGLKVVMHVRAVGSKSISGAGLKLEGLDSKWVKSSEVTLTLGNYDTNIPEGSVTATLETDGDCPVIRLSNLEWLTSAANTLNHSEASLYNTERRSKAEWLETGADLMNHASPLFTVTVRLKGTLRSSLADITEADEQVEAYTKAVTKTTTQNFFAVTTDGREIHLGGYAPLTSYASAYTQALKSAGITMRTDATYRGSDGQAWGVKVPVLTKHIYEGESFVATFPQWAEWLSSDGATYNGTWYLPENSDETNWVKWW